MANSFCDIPTRLKPKDRERADVQAWLASVKGKSARQKPQSSKQSKKELAAFRASKPKG